MTEYKPLPTLIREVREAAYAAGLADGDPSVPLDEKRAAQQAYGEAIGALTERLDSLGLR